jgi:hypothetical protein
MVTYEKFAEELAMQGIDETIVDKLIEEYRIVKRENLLDDHEKVILHSAKVSDLILALVKNKVTGKVEDINNLEFNRLFEEIRKYPKITAEDVILTLAIPRVAESVYTIRSKKDVAHVKTIDPSFIDSSYCISACDWMFSELALLFLKASPNEAQELINSVLKKKVPTIEEFEDGSIVILKKDLSLKEEFLLALYHNYPKRITNEDLMKILRYSNPTYAEKVLTGLEGERFVHRNNEGNKLTKNAIKHVEGEILTRSTVKEK